MKVFCETVFLNILPALRAAIARELLEKYEMNQEEIAKRLGITQPAVSQYKSGIRGIKITNKKLIELAKDLASEIASGSILSEKICEICKKSRSEILANENFKFLCLLEMKKVRK